MQEDRKAEAAAREKLQKEIDSLKSTKYQLEEQITVSQITLDVYMVRYHILFKFAAFKAVKAGQKFRCQ